MKASRRPKKVDDQNERAKGVTLEQPNLPSATSETVVLSGSLDQYAAESLKTKALLLLDADGDAVFDFSEVERMHAAALQVLLALSKDLEPKERKVILKSVDPGVRKLFHISGTEELFKFSDGSH